MVPSHTTIYKRFFNLLIKPGSEWKAILQEGVVGSKAVNGFALPVIGITTAAAFLGSLFNKQGIDFELALKISIITFLSLFGGVYLASLLLNYSLRLFNLPENKENAYTLVSFGISLYAAISFIIHLIPEFGLLWVFIVYTGYIVSEGVKPLFRVKDEMKSGFILVSSIIILISPLIIQFILKQLMPGFQVV